jgi:hypothetical protein
VSGNGFFIAVIHSSFLASIIHEDVDGDLFRQPMTWKTMMSVVNLMKIG